jgi:hypothetical protein
MAAFFEAKQFAVAGQSAALNWSSHSAHTVIAGATRAFVDACAGVLPSVHKVEVRIAGRPPLDAQREGLVTYVPSGWTSKSTRSPHMLAQAAADLAARTTDVAQALERFELGPHRHKPVCTLTPALQRATEFACAYAAQTKALLFDDPFADIHDARAIAWLEARFHTGFEDCRWLAFVPWLDPQQRWHVGAQVLRLHNGQPDTRTFRTRYLVQTSERSDALVERLRAHGLDPREGPHSRVLYLDAVPDTATLFQSAEETGTRIVRFEQVEVE